MRGGLPMWGACLGAQLLAAEPWSGGRSGPRAEVVTCSLSSARRPASPTRVSVLPGEFGALQWHADTGELPEGAVHLARSDAYPHQAFVWARVWRAVPP